MLLKKIAKLLFNWRSELRAYVANRLVTRRVVRVLELTHAQELAITPRNEWAIVRQKQLEEIQAVQSGQLDIVDRRSWSYPYLPEALHRLNQPVLKNTPYNLRRFSETPVPRRAINLIKNAILSRRWRIKPTKEYADNLDPDRELRIRVLTECFKRPNNTESFREWAEAIIEDFLLNGAGVWEHRLTPLAERPFKTWAVDSSTIRIFLDWTESTPDRPRYAQMTGLKGERGIVTFLSDELGYIRDNVRTATPFGLGKLEVAFNTVNAFLGVQDMSSRAGSDQIHKTWLWWEQTLNPAHIQTIRRHITNELEGQAKLSLIAGAKAPQVVSVQAVTPDDLLLDWQKFLIQIIALSFDMSPQALLEERQNRATAQVLQDSDWQSAVVPPAMKIQEGITRFIIHGLLGWKDLEFEFQGLEDADPITRTVIQQRLWSMNSITANEIRESNNMPPLVGPWGKLPLFLWQLIIAEAQAKLGGKATGSPQGGGGSAIGMGSKAPTSGSLGSGGSMSFSAQDIAQMQPDELQLLQELGILPQTQQLAQQMDQQQPGILDQLSDELRQYFEQEKAFSSDSEVEAAPITEMDEDYQMERFLEDQHQESLAEKTINRRGVFGPSVNEQVSKNPERGKYPRSGGRYIDQQGEDRVLDTGKPSKRNRPGRGNRYQ